MTTNTTPRETQVIVFELAQRVDALEQAIGELQRRANGARAGAGSFPGTSPQSPTQRTNGPNAHWLDYVRFPNKCAGCGIDIPRGNSRVWYAPAGALSEHWRAEKARLWHESCAPDESRQP